MATSRTTFKKRQKEIARVEKQREKTARRLERKKGPQDPEPELTLEAAAILRLQKLSGTEDQHSSGNTGDSYGHSDDTPPGQLSR